MKIIGANITGSFVLNGVDLSTTVGSYSTTGSNSFSDSQYVEGNITASGTIRSLSNIYADNNITAAHLYAQSLSTGSGPLTLTSGPGYPVEISGSLSLRDGAVGSFTGSFSGSGANLVNIPASGIVGLNLSQIASGSATASISPDNGFNINSNTQVTGSLQVTGGISGSFSGSGANLSNIPAAGIVGLQLNQIASSTATASISSTLFSVNVPEYISDTTNATSFTSPASIYTDGGMRVTKDAFVSGTLSVNNLTVYSTQSVAYITSSQLNVGTSTITLNSQAPAVRFAGISIYDSGSVGATGSLFWDSQNNGWIYNRESGSTYSGGHLISGPRNTGSLGSEQTTTTNALIKGQGGDHITSSLITDDGTALRIPYTLIVTGSITGTSLTGSIAYSNLTGVPTLVSGSSQISYTSLSSIPAGIVSSSAQVTGIGNSQLTNSSFYVGTTSISLGRSSTSQTLTGVSIDGNAATATAAQNSSFQTQPNSTWSAKIQLGGNGDPGSNSALAVVQATDGNLHLDCGTGKSTYLNYYRNGTIYLNGTSYYISSNGSSYNGNSATTSQRTFTYVRTDGINRGSYGSISVAGSNNSYGGIDFTDQNMTLMINSGATGFYYTNNTWRVYWDGSGNQNNTGDVTAYASDKRLKTNIINIPNALDKIRSINGVTYDWKLDECAKWDFNPQKHDVGVIAQEIQEICPEAVTFAPFDRDPIDGSKSKSGENYLTVKYEKLVPLLIEAIKEQQSQIEELKAKLG